MPPRQTRFHFNRITFLIISAFLLSLIITVKLAYLQIIKHEKYETIAKREHLGYTELPARRGKILTRDYHSGELFELATNVTLDLLFADPTLIEQKNLVATTLAPIIFDAQEEVIYDQKRVKAELAAAKTEEDKTKIHLKNESELKDSFVERLQEQLSQETRLKILLEKNLTEEITNQIKSLNMPGITVFNSDLYAVPKDIQNLDHAAETLSPYLEITKSDLKAILLGRNRYVILEKKLSPDQSAKIKAIIKNDPKNFTGIGLKENYYRFYPEKSLAAPVLGFVDNQSIGRYGVEETFEPKLKGKIGIFSSQRDASGKQITVGDSVIKPAVDGDDVVLTIDRAIQMEIEKKLSRTVEATRADSGQAIVMDPVTGRILAMAQYPSFNPNEYGKVFDKEEIKLTDDEKTRLVPLDDDKDPRHFMFIIDPDHNLKMEIFKEQDEQGNTIYLKYKNKVGPKVYRNANVADIYEPGSVFKALTMASAINDHDVTPNTTVNASAPLKVDCKKDGTCDFEIKNAQDKYRGVITMTQVLEFSDNIGISFVARKLGGNLFYSYIKNFGFGDRTDIELTEEHPGQVEYFENWQESELLTHGFGQGIAVTPIQLITALSTLANNGIMMQPYIIDHIEEETGKITQTEPQIIRRVISKETADTVTSMLVSAIENGVAKQAQVKGHYIAGKTGTSQTYKNGKALSGAGNTITSIGGYGPIDKPKFVILIKFDHPRTDEWGSSTVAPLFSEIAEYLFNYYSIPPDKK